MKLNQDSSKECMSSVKILQEKISTIFSRICSYFKKSCEGTVSPNQLRGCSIAQAKQMFKSQPPTVYCARSYRLGRKNNFKFGMCKNPTFHSITNCFQFYQVVLIKTKYSVSVPVHVQALKTTSQTLNYFKAQCSFRYYSRHQTC